MEFILKSSIKIIKALPLLLLVFVFSSAKADDDCFPEKPNRMVNDYVNILNGNEINSLEDKLVDFNRKTSTQIAIVIVSDLCGYDKASYTYTLGKKWGVGQKGKDNGILIMVKPFGNAGQRHAFIATGYGAEGAVPDALANQIVNNIMIPQFKQGKYSRGLNLAVDEIMGLISGEYTAEHVEPQYDKAGKALSVLTFILVIGIFFFLRLVQTYRYAKVNHVKFWVAWSLLYAATRSRAGSYTGFSSRHGGFGGGGGGFGGFGGGGFGGGGAGGSW